MEPLYKQETHNLEVHLGFIKWGSERIQISNITHITEGTNYAKIHFGNFDVLVSLTDKTAKDEFFKAIEKIFK